MKFKNIVACLVALIFIISYRADIFARETVSPEKGNTVFRVATPNDVPSNIDRIIYEALAKMGYRISINIQGSDTAIDSLSSGEVDILSVHFAGLEKDHPKIIRIPEPVGKGAVTVFAGRDGYLSRVSSYREIRGKTVGILYQKGNINHELEKVSAHVRLYQSPIELFDALSRGEVEFVVKTVFNDTPNYLPRNVQKVGVLSADYLYFYVSSHLENLVPKLSAQLKDMRKSGRLEEFFTNKDLASSKKLQVMHISSRESALWLEEFNNGLLESLSTEEQVRPVEISNVNLNSRNFSSEMARNIIISNKIRSESFDDMPEAVIVSDYESLRFVRENYFELFHPVPVFVCGIPTYDTDMFYGFIQYFTGIVEVVGAQETASFALEKFPNANKLMFVGDYTDLGVRVRDEAIKQIGLSNLKLNISYAGNSNFSSLKQLLSGLDQNTIVLLGKYYLHENDDYISEKEMYVQMSEASKAPIFSLYSPYIGFGAVGGKTVDVYAEGQLAAKKILELFENPKLINAPIDPAVGINHWIFDKNALDKFLPKQSIELLPPQSKIINIRPTLYEEYPEQVIVGSVIIGFITLIILIIFYFMNILNKKAKELDKIQKTLHTIEEIAAKDREIEVIKSRLEQTIQSAPIGFIKSQRGTCVDTNKYAEEVANIYPGVYLRQKIDIDDKTEESLTGITIMTTDRGERRRFLYSASVQKRLETNDLFFWFIDIEERLQLSDVLKHARNKFEKLLDILPTPLLVSNFELSRVLYANNEMLKFTDSADLYDLQSKELDPRFMINDDENLLIINQEITYQGRRALALIAHDVGADRQKSLALFEATEREIKANELKSKFLVSMSHQIRTPMNAIVGLAQIEFNKNHDHDVNEIFKKINYSSKNLLTLIDDILDFSKIEAEELVIAEEEVDLEVVLSNALLMAVQRVGSKPVEILLDLKKNVPSRIISDQTRLWQILKNLLDNSAKYTQKGKIYVTVDVEHKTKHSTHISFTIVDTGYGMSSEQVNKLFTPFEQFHNRIDNQTGTGIGMTITKQLIDLMRGSIYVESVVGEGTKIRVTIPFLIPAGTSTIGEIIKNVSLKKKKVLVVDDEPIVLDIISGILEAFDIYPTLATSGEDAIKLVTECYANKNYFDVIVLDCIMPGINGIETARRLKGVLQNTPTKLLMVSAHIKQLLSREIMSAGFDDVLEKPFAPTEFVSKICDAVDAPVLQKLQKTKFRNARILLCEDNLTNQDVAMGILEVFGIEPVIANNGLEGIELLNKQKFDLILMDIMMPVLDGHETTRMIRSSGRSYKDIPIIAMTANVMREEIDRCFANGMNAHISKPINMEKLLQTLVEFLPKSLQYVGDEKDDETVSQGVQKNLNGGDIMLNELMDLGFDVDGALKRFVNKQERYFKSLRTYFEKVKLPEFDADHIEEMAKEVHMIKGIAGNLGITPIYELCLTYEADKNAENYNILFETNNKICTELSKLLNA